MDSTGLEKSGYVLKKADVMPAWNSRYIIADPARLRLKYYKDRPKSGKDKERGSLDLTDCLVSVDASCNADQYRFLIITQKHNETYHLEVDDDWERQEWIRVIRLISELGVTKRRCIDEKKMDDNEGTFKRATELLLQSLDKQATDCRNTLDSIAQNKWEAKCRLIVLRDEMQEKHRKLRANQNEMKGKENSYREELSHLNQALYVLQKQVRKSNEIQQSVVEIFGGSVDPATSGGASVPILQKAKQAVDLCQQLLQSNYPQRRLFARQGSVPRDDQKDGSPKKKTKKMDPSQDRTKGRARSYSDLAVPKSAIFEDEMAKIIIDAFPDIQKPSKNDYSDENANVIRIFELYHKYYVEVHLPREMELIKIRTKCEQKYNSLRYVSNKKELARREEDEIDWIMSEINRAIDRLSREGVVLDPTEQKSPQSSSGSKDTFKSNKSKYKKKDDAQGKHRGSSTMVPVLAHRSSWSETSETIFQLNAARQQQYKATKDLEESLKSRELVKSWYEEKIA